MLMWLLIVADFKWEIFRECPKNSHNKYNKWPFDPDLGK